METNAFEFYKGKEVEVATTALESVFGDKINKSVILSGKLIGETPEYITLESMTKDVVDGKPKDKKLITRINKNYIIYVSKMEDLDAKTE